MRATAPRPSHPTHRSAPRDRAAGLRRPHRADDPVLLAEQIQRFHGFFGEADDPAGRELAHG
jgi:hypothetical protein